MVGKLIVVTAICVCFLALFLFYAMRSLQMNYLGHATTQPNQEVTKPNLFIRALREIGQAQDETSQ